MNENQAYREAAKNLLPTRGIVVEVSDTAKVQVLPTGAFVSVQVWVPRQAVKLDSQRHVLTRIRRPRW